MNSQLKKFSLLPTFFFMSVALAQTTSMESLESWEKRNPNWVNDTSEIAYAASRCGALYEAIGAAFTHLGQTPSDKQRGTNTTLRGMMLVLVGNELAKKVGWSDEKLSQRYKYNSETYFKTISSNRINYNNMFYGTIETDFKFCVDIEKQIIGNPNQGNK